MCLLNPISFSILDIKTRQLEFNLKSPNKFKMNTGFYHKHHQINLIKKNNNGITNQLLESIRSQFHTHSAIHKRESKAHLKYSESKLLSEQKLVWQHDDFYIFFLFIYKIHAQVLELFNIFLLNLFLYGNKSYCILFNFV